MTVFHKPPGLIGKDEPLGFTSSGDVVAVSVGFDVVEERVYRDGAFLVNYTQSTRAGNTFSIVRDGGWPADPTIYVDDAAGEVPTSGQTFGAIYDVDLRQQPSQLMTAAGQYTIDGKEWWAKGPLITNTPQTCEILNGTGLRMTRPDPISTTSGFMFPGPYLNRAMCFRLSQLADYNPLAPLVVMWRLASPRTITQMGQNQLGYGALLTVAPNADVITIVAGGGLQIQRAGMTSAYWSNPQYAGRLAPSIVAPLNASDVIGDGVPGIYRYAADRHLPLIGQWTGALPAGPDQMQSFSVASGVEQYRVLSAPTLNPADTWFVFACDKTAQENATMDIALTHLKIMQPRVAA